MVQKKIQIAIRYSKLLIRRRLSALNVYNKLINNISYIRQVITLNCISYYSTIGLTGKGLSNYIYTYEAACAQDRTGLFIKRWKIKR